MDQPFVHGMFSVFAFLVQVHCLQTRGEAIYSVFREREGVDGVMKQGHVRGPQTWRAIRSDTIFTGGSAIKGEG